MDIRFKVVLAMTAVVAGGLGLSFGVGSLLADNEPNPFDPTGIPEPIAAAVDDIPFDDATKFASTAFSLDEGYQIQLVDGWQLVAQTPTRRVDRYRFERIDDKDSILTISVYDATTLTSFDELVRARYGASFLREQKDVLINNLPALRVSAEFLDMGATLDVLVAADEQHYFSIYGIHAPAESSNLEVSKQINYMQKSFRKS